MPDTMTSEVHPLTPERWDDLATLFAPNGAYSGCWCMFWRVTRTQWAEQAREGGEANRVAFRAVVASGEVPGLLAYAEGKPVGWIAVAPRQVYAALERSTTRSVLMTSRCGPSPVSLWRMVGGARASTPRSSPLR